MVVPVMVAAEYPKSTFQCTPTCSTPTLQYPQWYSFMRLRSQSEESVLNVGLIKRFSNIDQSAVHLIPLSLEYCQLPYNVQGILIPSDGLQWTIFLATT